jgi:hypothetical protein
MCERLRFLDSALIEVESGADRVERGYTICVE